MEQEPQRIVLADGGHVAVQEYGARDGVPVFFFHGWPSSRTMAQLTDAAATALGVRMISLDRPGIRDSSFQPARTLLEWPALMREITAALGVETFRVLAVSGGAPYAFVTAWAMPERVAAIAVASGAPPIAELKNRATLLPLYNHLLALHDRAPWLLRGGFHLVRPFAAMKLPRTLRPLLLRFLQPCDAQVLRDAPSFEACFESARQAWKTSAKGVMADAEIYARPWGFALEEVRVPVRLWHGRKDRSFSFHVAEEVSERLPTCELHLVEDAGHYSLPIRHVHEILADLIRRTPPSS